MADVSYYGHISIVERASNWSMLNIYERECVCVCTCERAAVSSSKPLVCSRPPRPSSPRFQRAVLPPSTQPPPLRSWFLPQVARAGAAPQPGPLCLSARRSRDLPSSRTRHVLCSSSAHQPTGQQIARWLCAARCLHAKYSRAAASDVEGDLSRSGRCPRTGLTRTTFPRSHCHIGGTAILNLLHTNN